MIVSGACKERIHSALKYEQIMNLPEMALENFIIRIFRKTLAKMELQSLYLCGVVAVRVEIKAAPFRALLQFSMILKILTLFL